MNDPHPPRPPGWGTPAPGPGHFQPLPPQHPEATSVLVLGLVAVAGGLACYLPILVAPFAWTRGRRVLSEIDAEPGRWSGRGIAYAGFVMGIVGTCILALLLLVALVLIGVVAATPHLFGQG